ncbi:hypothetical protein NO559_16800 [Dasania sp. GY-MA-18]|uniref:Uncharacterized protein n=1 Tax=Dasania phycosphaerae TaxID=2950436 RepID=A0A9J6RQY5_9GAMM|nr:MULTISPECIES: PhnD/SsuA/transferrin family substrate-binding protein [Dasania]MCR8924435.1 hypothetical protein [Dasania sp. GY-MA-18]MCZ0867110.1 hypothetical protein [Dasania phycosphaerae]MCZ0870562.1 hypothetical protein [Dasania phycosphaerae]
MIRLSSVLLSAALLLPLGPAALATPTAIELHVYPLFSLKLRQAWSHRYQELLLKHAGVNTVFKSASSIEELILNAQTPTPKLIASPMHVALYLQKNYAYQLVMEQVYTAKWVLISKQETTFDGTSSLNGQCIAIPDRLSSISTTALAAINNTTAPDTHFQVIDKNTQDGSLFSVINNECAFAIVSDLLLEKALRSSLKNIKIDWQGDEQALRMVFSLSPQTPAPIKEVIASTLLSIGHDHQLTGSFLSPPARAINAQTNSVLLDDYSLQALHAMEQQLQAKQP